VKEARSVWLGAVEQRERMTEALCHTAIPFQDGPFVIAKARRAEATALAEYHRVLAICKKLLMGENSPPDEDEELMI